jgi:bifunctional non-homologous end joining protein LigD
MKLADYRKKRDRDRTPEPFGEDPPQEIGPTREGAFVVHLHDATRRHWDLRLEVGGVLASFAVPHGPSLDPSVRRLAVRTEDHPIEYLDFEAVIPEKSYGAGAMIVWDRGRVRYPEAPIEEGLDKGKIDFEVDGIKLKGRYGLVRIKGEENNWLLLKKRDAFASTTVDLVASAPRSVLSGLTVEELPERGRIGGSLEQAAADLGAPIGALDAKQIVPMPCASAEVSAAAAGWLYELKLDGVRILAEKDGDRVYLGGRKRREATQAYPEIARAVRSLAASRAVLDGEIVALDERGKPSFERIAQRIHLTRPHEVRMAMARVPVIYVAFDLLALGDRLLVDLPLSARKSLLARLVPGAGTIRYLDHLENDGRPLLALCADQDLEGIVAKRASSRYAPGPDRGGDWVKIKRRRDEDFVVVGHCRGEGARERLGALDVATFESGNLVNRGKVGSGLDEASVDALLALLAPLARDTPAAQGDLSPAPRGRTHVEPRIVVRVRFAGFSDGGHVRHGVFEGIRDDVDPHECTAAPKHALVEGAGEASAVREGLSEPEASPRFPVTNRQKVLFPDEGFTKGDLVGYYESIAPAMLPYLKDRPIAVVRYPDGIAGKSFYQWNVPPGLPDWVRTTKLVVPRAL